MKRLFLLLLIGICTLTVKAQTTSNRSQPKNVGTQDHPYIDTDGPKVYVIESHGHQYLLDHSFLGYIFPDKITRATVLKSPKGYEKVVSIKKFQVMLMTLNDKDFPDAFPFVKDHSKPVD